MSDEHYDGEQPCREGGNYGFCKTHPTCDLVQKMFATLRTQVAALTAERDASRCPTCGLGPMRTIEGTDTRYCENCINEAAASAEADGLEHWRAVANEYKVLLTQAAEALRPFSLVSVDHAYEERLVEAYLAAAAVYAEIVAAFGREGGT